MILANINNYHCTVNLMSSISLLDEIKRIKQTACPTKKNRKAVYDEIKLSETSSQPALSEQKKVLRSDTD